VIQSLRYSSVAQYPLAPYSASYIAVADTISHVSSIHSHPSCLWTDLLIL